MADISIYINNYTITSGNNDVTPSADDALELYICPNDESEPCFATDTWGSTAGQLVQACDTGICLEGECVVGGADCNIDSITIDTLGQTDKFLVEVQGLQQEGFLELRLNSSESGLLHFAKDDSNYFHKPQIIIGTNYNTNDLYGTSTISPNFDYEEITGCGGPSYVEIYGPFPDVNGLCRPDGEGDERLPNEFGFCLYEVYGIPYETNSYGYAVCNFDPSVNIDDDGTTCFGPKDKLYLSEQEYTVDWVESGAYRNPQGQLVADVNFCDCLGHVSDCKGNCLSEGHKGACSKDWLGSNQIYGCHIKTCNDDSSDGNDCVGPDDFINFWYSKTCKCPDGTQDCGVCEGLDDGVCQATDSSAGGMCIYDQTGDGVCESPELWGCSSIPQHATGLTNVHPLVQELVENNEIDESVNDYIPFNCNKGDCYNCSGGCSNDWYDGPGGSNGFDDCGLCADGISSTHGVFSCCDPENESTDANCLCIPNWSKDCAQLCEHTVEDGVATDEDVVDYKGPCYQIFDWEDGTCGYDCQNVCYNDAENSLFGTGRVEPTTGLRIGKDDCGVCGGSDFFDNGLLPDGRCDCDGNFPGCNGDCGSDTGPGSLGYEDVCGACGSTNPMMSYNESTGKYIAYDGVEYCDCSFNVFDCGYSDANGETGAPNSWCDDSGDCCGTGRVLDDCNVCGGTNYFQTTAGAPCGMYSSIDCLLSAESEYPGSCDCSGITSSGSTVNTYDCSAPDALDSGDLTDSCNGALVPDSCGVCGGSNTTGCADASGNPQDDCNTYCDCEGTQVDCAGVCGGDAAPDVCGVCRQGGWSGDYPNFNSIGEPYCEITIEGGVTAYIECCGGSGEGDSGTACDGYPPTKWCYDGNLDGYGSDYGFSESDPIWACEDPGPTYVDVCGEYIEECYCPSADESLGGACYDVCGVCHGEPKCVCPPENVACDVCNGLTDGDCQSTDSGDSTNNCHWDTATANTYTYCASQSDGTNYCCGGESYCGCDNYCTNGTPTTVDCADECGGSSVVDECGECDGGGIADGECDCDGNIQGCDGVCGSGAHIDQCGNCVNEGTGCDGGDCSTLDCTGDGDDLLGNDIVCTNSCGTCGAEFEPTACLTDGSTENMYCDCDANQCDECGNCPGDGKSQYYYDSDGDGIICSTDNTTTGICPGDSILLTKCGPGGGVNPEGYCWVIETTADLTFDDNVCMCPADWTIDECGRCIPTDYETGMDAGEDWHYCQYDSGIKKVVCEFENSDGWGDTCNSKFCIEENYSCVQACDGEYYIYEFIGLYTNPLGTDYLINNFIFIPPEFQPNEQEYPKYDLCANVYGEISDVCIKPQCSAWGIDGGGSPNGSLTGVCSEEGQLFENNVPTNPAWNSICVDCAGSFLGNAITACPDNNGGRYCEESAIELTDQGGGVWRVVADGSSCNDKFACEEIISQPTWEKNNPTGGLYSNVQYVNAACDGTDGGGTVGDCIDCAGDCGTGFIHQCNQHDISCSGGTDASNPNYCGCGAPGTLVSGDGCCQMMTPDNELVIGHLDCNNTCVENPDYIGDGVNGNSGYDCAGICKTPGDITSGAQDTECCDYRWDSQNAIYITHCLGTEGSVEGTSCEEVVYCGCYSDDTACNYDTSAADFDGVQFEGIGNNGYDYTCKDYTHSDYCGGTAINVGDCCDCNNNTLDCDLVCDETYTSNPQRNWYKDNDCDGVGNGSVVWYGCEDDGQDTTYSGCYSSILNADENDYCDSNIVWSDDIPSQDVNGRMLPIEADVCKVNELNQDDDYLVEYCSAIESQVVCESEQNPECVWESDYFYGVDDCGNCFRLPNGDLHENFNLNGNTATDCNGGCDGLVNDQCGDCDGDGKRCAGCMDEAATNYAGENSNPENWTCSDGDGNSIPCTQDCSVLDAYDGANDCCTYPVDCMGVEYPYTANGGTPNSFDMCGICTGPSAPQPVENYSYHCNCCPPADSGFYDGQHLNDGIYEFSIEMNVDNVSYRQGKCYDDGSPYDSENWVNPQWDSWDDTQMQNHIDTPGTYWGPYMDCSYVCWGDDLIDLCDDCSDPVVGQFYSDCPGYDYLLNTTTGDTNEAVYYSCNITYDDCCIPDGSNFNVDWDNRETTSGLQCSCVDGNILYWDQCGNCGGDGFEEGGPSGTCIGTNQCQAMDCAGECCISGGEGNACSEDYGTFSFADSHPNLGTFQCCPLLYNDAYGINTNPNGINRDWCGVCGGSSNGDSEVGDVGCNIDGITTADCFSGNITRACGCGGDEQNQSLHCIDQDGDGKGEGAGVSLCGSGTQNPFYLVTEGIYVPNCDDSYEFCNCAANDASCADGCGMCIADDSDYVADSLCSGCNNINACNYGMNVIGEQCDWGSSGDIPDDYENNGPCYIDNPDVCIMPISCGECGGTYCPDEGNIGDIIVPMCPGNWDNLGVGGLCETQACADFSVSTCPESLCHEGYCDGCISYFCTGLGQDESICYNLDECDVCKPSTEDGSINCSGPDYSNCACAGCMTEGCPTYNATYTINIPAGNDDVRACGYLDCAGGCTCTEQWNDGEGGIEPSEKILHNQVCTDTSGGAEFSEYDTCGTCNGEGAIYSCGCNDIENIVDDPANCDGTPCYCNCELEQWVGCDNVCGETPDVCGNCSDTNWGDCGFAGCACTGCRDDASADNYNPDWDYHDQELCLWNDCGSTDMVCTCNWQNGSDDVDKALLHSQCCTEGGNHYLDQCGTCFDDPNDVSFNECSVCLDSEAINGVAEGGDSQIPGLCFYGDLVILPQSFDGIGIDTYVFRPAGEDTFGVQCTDDNWDTSVVPDYWLDCNDNYGGFKVTDSATNTDIPVQQYKLDIIDPDGVTLNTSYANKGQATWGSITSGTGNTFEYMNPECFQNLPGMYSWQYYGMKNIHTFVECGMGYEFIKNGIYTIVLTISTDSGYYSLSKQVEITGTIDWEQSLISQYSPFQGLNVDIDDEDFKYRRQDFLSTVDGGFDADGRPSLGTFYYSDEPNNYINTAGNLSVDDNNGYYVQYYTENKSMSGLKWGGSQGIGKKYEGFIPNIEKECGVDKALVARSQDLTNAPQSQTGIDSNYKCFTPAAHGNDWVPDAIVYTHRSLEGGNKSRLWKYYDKYASPLSYYETTGPTEAIFRFTPTDSNLPFATTRDLWSWNENKPIYLTDIDWGDGQKSNENDLYNLHENNFKITHAYEAPGIYEINGYIFSMQKDTQCVFEETGLPDGRDWICRDDQDCVGYCSDVTTKCIGGSNHDQSCANEFANICSDVTGLQGTDKIVCQPDNVPTDEKLNVGVDRYFRFTIRININEPDDYMEHPYILNDTNTVQPMIGGLSTNSIYYKNIIRQLGYFPDIPEQDPLDLYFQQPYYKYLTEYALLQMDETFFDDDLDIKPFMDEINFNSGDFNCTAGTQADPACPCKQDSLLCDGSNDNVIWTGKYNKHFNELGKHIGNTDIGQVRYFNKGDIQMYQMLGFIDDTNPGTPGNIRYWKNIVNEDFIITDRTGLYFGKCKFDFLSTCTGGETDSDTCDVCGGIWYDDIIRTIDVDDSQQWSDGSYYPVLPKIDQSGNFGSILQGYEENISDEFIPLGHPNRDYWDTVDNFSLITGITSNDYNQYLLIDLDFSSEDDGMLQDLSGNGNDAFIQNDYRIEYEQETRTPEKIENQVQSQIDQNGKQF